MTPLSTLNSEQENSLAHERVYVLCLVCVGACCLLAVRAHVATLLIICIGGNITSATYCRVSISQARLTKANLMSKWLMKGELIVLLKLCITFIWVLPWDDSFTRAMWYARTLAKFNLSEIESQSIPRDAGNLGIDFVNHDYKKETFLVLCLYTCAAIMHTVDWSALLFSLLCYCAGFQGKAAKRWIGNKRSLEKSSLSLLNWTCVFRLCPWQWAHILYRGCFPQTH